METFDGAQRKLCFDTEPIELKFDSIYLKRVLYNINLECQKFLPQAVARTHKKKGKGVRGFSYALLALLDRQGSLLRLIYATDTHTHRYRTKTKRLWQLEVSLSDSLM